MKYMGSKARIAKHILPIILRDRKEGQWYVEPFVGGANMIDKVDGNRIGYDSNEYLISLLIELKNGWIPPCYVSEEEWRDVRTKMDFAYPKHYIAFVRLGCSFGSDWNGGYARNVRKDAPNSDALNKTIKSYCRQSANNMIKQAKSFKGITFSHSSYDSSFIPPQSVIYCDPPYAGTTKYKDDFNHEEFWEWCRKKVKDGHQVFISEYNAPDDFVCVWRQELNVTVARNGKHKKAIEKLFVHESQV